MNWYRVYVSGWVDVVTADDTDEAEEIAVEGIGGLDYVHIDEVTLLEENTEKYMEEE